MQGTHTHHTGCRTNMDTLQFPLFKSIQHRHFCSCQVLFVLLILLLQWIGGRPPRLLQWIYRRRDSEAFTENRRRVSETSKHFFSLIYVTEHYIHQHMLCIVSCTPVVHTNNQDIPYLAAILEYTHVQRINYNRL